MVQSRGFFLRMNNVRRGPKGIFEFRKAVPAALREAVGKWEWKQSLKTSDEAVAMLRARKLERAIAAQVENLKASLNGPGALTALNEAKRLIADLGPITTDLRLVADDLILQREGYDRLEDFLEDEANPRKEVVANALALAQGEEVRIGFKLSDALKLYLKDRGFDHKAELERKRQVNDLIAHLKADKDIEKVNRVEARSYMEKLVKDGYAPGSVNKQINSLKAMFTLALRELESDRINPWAGLKAKDDEAEKDKRRPFTLDEAKLVLSKLATCNDQLRRIGILTAYTGARLSEIRGLDASEVRGGSILIQPNAHRRLKNKSSKRVVPLFGPALEAVKGLPEKGPLFPKYASNKNSASQSLMAMLRNRAGIKDGKATWHSWRHLVKDLFRNANVDKETRDRLMGHSAGDVAFNYGAGPELEHLRAELERALKPLL